MQTVPIHVVSTFMNLTVFGYGSKFIAIDNRSTSILAAPADHPIHKSNPNIACLDIQCLPESVIRAFAFHPNGNLLAVASDSRTIQIWDLRTWSIAYMKTVLKRPNALLFTGTKDVLGDLIVADKFGDVYRVPLSGSNEKLKLLLGHCSLVTDMILSRPNGLLITSDRDEKIRVSLFPETYEIDGFCLGHTGFISKMCMVPNRLVELVSGGGDGQLIFWNFVSHKEVHRIDFRTLATQNKQPAPLQTIKSCPQTSRIAALFQSVPKVFLLHSSSAGGNFEVESTVDLDSDEALDIEFTDTGDLVVVFGVGAKKLVGVVGWEKAAQKYGQINLNDKIASLINEVGTVESSESIDYGAYLQILRKSTDENASTENGRKRRNKGGRPETEKKQKSQ